MRIDGYGISISTTLIQVEVMLSSIMIYLHPTLSPYLITVIAATAVIPDINRSIYSPSFQRQTAWILLALAIMEALTGFAAGPVSSNMISRITGGLLTRGLGLQLHLLLIDPLAFFFILHIASGIGLALIRRGIKWQPLYRFIIPIFLILGFAAVTYLDSLFF